MTTDEQVVKVCDNICKILEPIVKQYKEKQVNEKHLCDTCQFHPEECDAEEIEWGIDRDPHAIGAYADRVLDCDTYKAKQAETEANDGK
jgi:hypothetical protein